MSVMIVGGGNMGSALARSFLNSRLVVPQKLLVVEKDDALRDRIIRDLSCHATKGLEEGFDHLLTFNTANESGTAAREESVSSVPVILAIKPQDFSTVINSLKSKMRPEHLLISILAGVSTGSLRRELENGDVVRCMPNTPAQIAKGMSILYAPKETSKLNIELAERLFRACGETLWVDDEDLVNSGTAVSGSGPAYFFYMIEGLIAAAEELGFSKEQGALMATQTAKGAIDLLIQSGLTPEELRRRVTSKGGTTEAALLHLENVSYKEQLVSAVKAAAKRAAELNQ